MLHIHHTYQWSLKIFRGRNQPSTPPPPQNVVMIYGIFPPGSERASSENPNNTPEFDRNMVIHQDYALQ